MMAYKDPPREKGHNGAPCLVIALVILGAAVVLVGAPSGWWA